MQNDLVSALCWTLIHSLWQGLLLAAVTGAFLIGTRRANARKRYNLLTVLFLLFIVATVITFAREMYVLSANSIVHDTPNFIITQQHLLNTVTPAAKTSGVGGNSFLDRFTDYFNTHASLVVTIWFVIFIARFVKLTTNLVYVQRLKFYKTHDPSQQWKDKIAELVGKLGLRKQVELLESGIVKVPVVMGVFKPVILLPLGLLAHLPSDELEAILLHELAHIQRRDYFVNLLQSFAETIFFFNPALMWLSSMIREERENCCDDMAIAVTNNKTKFINALIAFQEYNFSNRAYSIGFPGKKNQLLNRVKRIISNRNKTLNATEKSLLTFGMAVLIMFSLVAAKKTPVNETVGSVNKKPLAILSQKKTQPIEAVSLFKQPHPETGKVVIARDTVATRLEALLAKLSDTVPQTKEAAIAKDALLSKFATVSDTAVSQFSHFSTMLNDDGQTKTLVLTATTKDGKQYRLKKINDVISEFSINDERVPESKFEEHREEIAQIENAYRNKMIRVKERQLLANQKRLLSFEKDRTMYDMKRATLEKQRLLTDEKQWSRVEKIRTEANKRIADETNRKIDRKITTALNEQQRVAFDKKIHLFKGSADSLKRRGLMYGEERAVGDKKRLLFKGSADSMKRRGLMYGEERAAFDKKRLLINGLADSVRRMGSRNENHEWEQAAFSRKQEIMKWRQADDETRQHEAAMQMQNIISDLGKENIKIDMQKSWFALDNDQFIVDGKKMSSELHDTFKAKYLKPNGWGYYYGPIQVRGRGLFLDYKDLVK